MAKVAQWCLPSLRQQRGKLASAALVANSGRAKGSANSVSSEMAKRGAQDHYGR